METDRGKLMKESEEAYIRELHKELTREEKPVIDIMPKKKLDEILRAIEQYILKKARLRIEPPEVK